MAAFAWHDFLRLAERMATNKKDFGGNEALRRSAASRAYYACYHEAEALACAHGFVHQLNNNHAALINWFRSQSDRSLCSMGGVLATLKQNRVHADYEPRSFSQHLATQTLYQARSFIIRVQKRSH